MTGNISAAETLAGSAPPASPGSDTDTDTDTEPNTDARGGRSSASGNALQKTLRVLEALSALEADAKLIDIARNTGISKPSVHRILASLVGEGYALSRAEGTYAPGPRLLAIASQLHSRRPESVQQELTALSEATGQTVHLAVRSGDQAIYTHKVQHESPIQMVSRVGASLPLHSTAIGKAVLAQLPTITVEEIIARTGMPRRTERSVPSLAELRGELDRIREAGWALDDEENEPSIRCLGVPLFNAAGEPIGGLSISTVTFLVEREALLAFAEQAKAAAARIQGML